MKSFPLSVLILSFLIFSGHAGVHNTTPYPITELPWQEAVISVTDLEKTAEFFKKIGGFKELYRGQSSKSSIKHYGLTADASAEELLLSAKGSDVGFIRLIRFDNTDTKKPMRPGSRAWDTGCYFSLMVRMKGLREIYEELKRISKQCKELKIDKKEFFGGSMTISSLGGIGGNFFTPIINPPEVAILGVGKTFDKIKKVNGQFIVRKMLPISLSYDHRVIDGAEGARFCVHLSKSLGKDFAFKLAV